MMKRMRRFFLPIFVLSCLLLLAACGTFAPVTREQPQATVTVNPSFQAQLSPVPTFATYVCGAWSSNNAPSSYSTIIIYARLTHHIQGISGATATATVNFAYGNVELDTQPVSDNGGYVTFVLPLDGRQPTGVPATVSVSFSGIPGYSKTVQCTQAFFTPK
jgi:hypothetical protein